MWCAMTKNGIHVVFLVHLTYSVKCTFLVVVVRTQKVITVKYSTEYVRKQRIIIRKL